MKQRHKISEESVLERVHRLFASQGPSPFVGLGMGDDAALLQPSKNHEIVLTCDWFLEGTHFLRDVHPPDSIGWKCLARAVSDIAAMGGRPRCFLLSLALPKSCAEGTRTELHGEQPDGRWLDGFMRGLSRASKNFGCVLAGGDTTARNEILFNVTVVGEIRRGRAILRSGARPGDILYVSGRLGEAELGLRMLRQAQRRDGKLSGAGDAGLQKHLYPEPRLELGRWLGERRLATSMMDLSDGLSSDLRRLCEASRAGAKIETTKIPTVHFINSRNPSVSQALELALHGGDDYELLFTVKKANANKIPRALKGVPITPIGEITTGREVSTVDGRGRLQTLQRGGWDPFR